MNPFGRRCLALALGLAVAVSAGGEPPAEPPDPAAAGLTPAQRRVALVARSAWEHARLETLEADFVQHKESVLLLEPEESRGSFSYRAPDAMRWDYDLPEASAMTVIVSGQEMVTRYRDGRPAERVDLGRRGQRMLELLGPGASLADLEPYFTLSVELPEAAGEPYRVDLEPRSGRIARRLRSIRMELDHALFLPTFVRLIDPEGGVTELSFDRLRVNRPLPAGHF